MVFTFIYEFELIFENFLKPGKSVNYYNPFVIINQIVLIVMGYLCMLLGWDQGDFVCPPFNKMLTTHYKIFIISIMHSFNSTF